MMGLLDILLSAVVLSMAMTFLVVTGASVLTLYPDYSAYKPFYKNLPKMEFIKRSTLVYGYLDEKDPSPYSDAESIIYFPDRGGFKLGDTYLHNNGVTNKEPYSKYYLRLYQDFMDKNTDHG